MSFNAMFNRLQGQPESYERKAKYRFGKTLGAGTYGIVREADGPDGKVAIKIILKKNVKGNERMVWDELDMLQRLKHPHIVRFVDSFESKDKYYIVTSLRQVESCSTAFASKESSRRRMHRKLSSRFSELSTFSITTTLSIVT